MCIFILREEKYIHEKGCPWLFYWGGGRRLMMIAAGRSNLRD